MRYFSRSKGFKDDHNGQVGFPHGLVVKNPPVMQEMQVQFLSWEDPPEKKMATHSSILTCEIAWTEEPGRLQLMGSQKSQTSN